MAQGSKASTKSDREALSKRVSLGQLETHDGMRNFDR